MEGKATISIMGCGWLGLPLAKQLISIGYSVKGSTTTPDKLSVLQTAGIEPYLIDFSEAEPDTAGLASFLQSDILLLNIPPRLRSDSGESYLQQMRLLLKSLLNSSVNRVLFVSSTSVYLDLNRTVTEEDTIFTEEKEPDNTLLQVEKMFCEREEWLTTVVRFAGLVGGDRRPGRFMAGKTNVPNGDAPVNLIHLEDCVAILQRIIVEQKWGEVYNACADEHPLRKDFYTKAAEAIGLTPPTFAEVEKTAFKLIKSERLKEDLSYVFIHPDPMLFF
ncbi:SDR family NAD(P)-dependent oxidoreductase [Pontibacter harenae]|uniref:SDR family NAD(P)-dependent oxidoreductase n=1 Tax=Pontibacter harenae TaxID=2894083 RepID=UPI001E405B4F|nr:SDR family NAD(P)-dependent oxidoreductase [Pontibacter harenae]MCC9165594.1 SDR family NAD(P)-dependent oxidoreductase [Pontibacter harenae]